MLHCQWEFNDGCFGIIHFVSFLFLTPDLICNHRNKLILTVQEILHKECGKTYIQNCREHKQNTTVNLCCIKILKLPPNSAAA